MEIGLDNDEYISLVLTRLIPSIDIRLKIIEFKNILETKDALDYHKERWETISSKYFKSVEKSDWTHSQIYYSYVLDNNEYISEGDRCLDYYFETGVSYQVRDLLLSLLRRENYSDDSIKEDRKFDDTMYGILAEKITKKIKFDIDRLLFPAVE